MIASTDNFSFFFSISFDLDRHSETPYSLIRPPILYTTKLWSSTEQGQSANTSSDVSHFRERALEAWKTLREAEKEAPGSVLASSAHLLRYYATSTRDWKSDIYYDKLLEAATKLGEAGVPFTMARRDKLIAMKRERFWQASESTYLPLLNPLMMVAEDALQKADDEAGLSQDGAGAADEKSEYRPRTSKFLRISSSV